MKKSAFFVALMLMAFTFSAFAQKQAYTYSFKKPGIALQADGYSKISYKECANLGKEGTPILPQFAANILLPPGTEAVSVNITKIEYYPEENGITIPPASRQFPISKGAPAGYKPVLDNKIYFSETAYPVNNISAVSTNFLNGHSISSFSICPLTYYPALKKVQFVKEICIEIVTKSTERASTSLGLLRSNERINQRIRSLTQHNELISDYEAKSGKDDPTYDILLITKSAFLSYFNDYVTYKQSTGYAVTCKTVEDIYTQYTGTDNQMKIRNCIIDYYQNSGISYVILAGDADPNIPSDNIVPKRGFYADPGDMPDNDIPSDMYYACLDGTWNNDNDNKWGEANEADLYYEVGIGRLCVDSQTEIQNFINKLTLYQSSPVVADIKKGLMIGEQLDDITYGDDSKDEIISGGAHNGYTTVGFPLDYTISKLYESIANWEKENVFSQFNNGTHLLNHLGHSNVTYNMKMENSDVTTTNFQNNGIAHGYGIGYSQGCYNGSFDNRDDASSYVLEDCFAEVITTISTAEVACIANSRYGWYEQGGTNGASQFFDRQFFDAIFGENIFLIGDVNSDSKEDNVTYINSDDVIRWCAYETNLFGDPTMDIWTDVPTDIIATYPASVSVGISQIDFQTNAPNARIGLMQNGSLIGRGLTDVSGNATITFSSILMDVNPIAVSIIGHNRNRHQGTIIVVSDQPYVIFQSNLVNDVSGNNNGQLDPGESVTLNLGLQNVGTQPATNVNVTLITTNTNITLTDATENYGDFAAGELKTIDNGFALTVSNAIPDQQAITFDVQAVGNSTWDSYFTLIANAPSLSVGTITIDDSQGNGNGRLDPGETAIISFTSINNGHTDAINTTGTLVSLSSLITVSDPVYTIGTLGTGQSYIAQFTIQIDAAAALGAISQLTYTLGSGAYQTVKDYYAKIGLIVEDWETGNFNQFSWQSGGNSSWTIISSGAYEGTYCSKSGTIGNNQSSVLTLNINVAGSDTISFYRKVSSEATYDFLKFYIDNDMKEQWSGEEGWARVSYPVTSGNHTFKWSYVKDQYESGGSDCAWLDYIELPAPISATAYAGTDASICRGDNYNCNGTATNYTSVSWTTSGTGTFSSVTILNPVYTPSQADIDAGSVTLILTIQGSTGTFSDGMLLTIKAIPEITMTETGSVCESESYTISGTSVINYSSLDWITSGTGTFNNATLLNPVYTPSSADIENGQVTLTLQAFNAPCEPMSGNMLLTFDYLPATPAMPDGPGQVDLAYTITSVYTIDAVANANSYSWRLAPENAGTIASATTEAEVTWNTDFTGDVVLTVEGINDCGSGIASGEKNIYVDNTTGTGENTGLENLKVYPNPSDGNFYLQMNTASNTKTYVRIYNVYGVQIYNDVITANGSSLYRVNLNSAVNGIYLVEAESNGERTTGRFIIKK
ncbi:MAG: C25 family cysteine peptidase [Lentimicrobiaceae bacterium]|nr:C25 family cysteine peptidase [Lentimicrobiaceae bacterium]